MSPRSKVATADASLDRRLTVREQLDLADRIGLLAEHLWVAAKVGRCVTLRELEESIGSGRRGPASRP